MRNILNLNVAAALVAIAAAAFAAFMAAKSTAPTATADKVHRLALQVSDNAPEKMNAVLNVASNVVRHYTGKGEMVEVQVVAFNAGLNMLRTDKSPVLDRLKVFAESMPNVTFDACENTRQGMAKAEGKKPDEIPLVPNAKVVPAGVVTLIDLDKSGWTIIRP